MTGPGAAPRAEAGAGPGHPPTVALVGANGHGRWHRRAIAPLHAAGRVRLVGLVDVRPLDDDPAAPVPPEARAFTDHRAMLAAVRPDVVVLCTPPHTHLPIALNALAAGADPTATRARTPAS
ncbi:Gfo/Idh/MocA family oxidoreductase [Micromonospora fulviviridis]|uniref:Gfo/Idh/MocA family oxidoreductase n=1 Tax=Micromonospora fulviviridis TaxID=47860 RepID=A0ABV2VHA6_9ACTN